MIAESFISFKRGYISQRELLAITNYISQLYDPLPLNQEVKLAVVALLKHDQKNDQSGIKCVLLDGIGATKWNEELTELQALESIEFIEFIESIYNFN